MRYLAWLLPLLILPFAPNLLWLATSTLRIENASPVTVTGLGYRACDSNHELGSLAPGASVLLLLEACGDDSLSIILDATGYCQMYIEGEMYHVDATISASNRVSCSYDDPLSGLLLLKAMR